MPNKEGGLLPSIENDPVSGRQIILAEELDEYPESERSTIINAHVQEARSGGLQTPRGLEEHQAVKTINQLDALLAIIAEDEDLFVTFSFNNEEVDKIRAKELLS